MRKLKFAIPMVLILAGCGDEQENSTKTEQKKVPAPTFSITTDDPDINRLLPAIRQLLPGLDKYAEQFQEKAVERNRFLTIKFHIPDNATIPAEYAATGHNCFIEINKEGTAVKVPKSACKSVVLNRVVQGLDSDYWFYLYADQLTYKPYDFAKLNDKERIDIGVTYLKKVWDTVQEVQQKTDWQPDDFPNYGRLFRQLENEGKQFVIEGDMFPAYGSCMMTGAYAQSWWSEQVGSLKDLSSNEPQKISAAVKQIKRQYDLYYESAVSCSKGIRQAPPKPKRTVTLPPTPDNKPPRPGCLAVFKPDDTTEWTCPAK
ncbi:hypothetical protein [Dickeya oryzae]|uniref:hypothetical protein n=1 Tax=Dickeya oryzae TaxID=1240404 RepID=UPI00039F4CCE|nr:hypothetical protein [Dickeya oryzae]